MNYLTTNATILGPDFVLGAIVKQRVGMHTEDHARWRIIGITSSQVVFESISKKVGRARGKMMRWSHERVRNTLEVVQGPEPNSKGELWLGKGSAAVPLTLLERVKGDDFRRDWADLTLTLEGVALKHGILPAEARELAALLNLPLPKPLRAVVEAPPVDDGLTPVQRANEGYVKATPERREWVKAKLDGLGVDRDKLMRLYESYLVADLWKALGFARAGDLSIALGVYNIAQHGRGYRQVDLVLEPLPGLKVMARDVQTDEPVEVSVSATSTTELVQVPLNSLSPMLVELQAKRTMARLALEDVHEQQAEVAEKLRELAESETALTERERALTENVDKLTAAIASLEALS
jgi:hypothetical protein